MIYAAAAGISPTLNEVYMPCMSNDECALTFGNTIQPGNICTDTTGGHSACNVITFLIIIDLAKFLKEILVQYRVTLAAH
jgi:hypothetical protein